MSLTGAPTIICSVIRNPCKRAIEQSDTRFNYVSASDGAGGGDPLQRLRQRNPSQHSENIKQVQSAAIADRRFETTKKCETKIHNEQSFLIRRRSLTSAVVVS